MRADRRTHKPGNAGIADESDTPLVRRALRALATPTDQLSPGQIRLLIGQQAEYERLVPAALVLLRDDPLLETDFYPGDLLAAVCRLPAEHWSAHPDQVAEVRRLTGLATASPDWLSAERPSDRQVRADLAAFRQATGGGSDALA